MKEKIADRLVSVKSIVTVVLTAVFAYLAASGRITEQNFMNVFLIIVGFYFGTQHEKKIATEEQE
jgi:hypothetical protein